MKGVRTPGRNFGGLVHVMAATAISNFFVKSESISPSLDRVDFVFSHILLKDSPLAQSDSTDIPGDFVHMAYTFHAESEKSGKLREKLLDLVTSSRYTDWYKRQPGQNWAQHRGVLSLDDVEARMQSISKFAKQNGVKEIQRKVKSAGGLLHNLHTLTGDGLGSMKRWSGYCREAGQEVRAAFEGPALLKELSRQKKDRECFLPSRPGLLKWIKSVSDSMPDCPRAEDLKGGDKILDSARLWELQEVRDNLKKAYGFDIFEPEKEQAAGRMLKCREFVKELCHRNA